MAQTLFEKVWDLHRVRTLPTGQTQLYIGLHLVHEVTSPQAFAELDERGWRVRAPERTFATFDHIVPTLKQTRPFLDVMAESMASALEKSCRKHGIRLYDLSSGHQGIVHEAHHHIFSIAQYAQRCFIQFFQASFMQVTKRCK